ncbi:MAG: hypothetical protein ACYCV6_03925 [Steroidobacteraceae bacterium]
MRLASGDDHPDAACKHLADAQALQSAGRADGAAYLSGYVVECALKALWLFERGVPPTGQKPAWKAGRSGHEIGELQKEIATISVLASANIARYVGPAISALPTTQIAAWNPMMRYKSPSMTVAAASAWVAEALSVYDETIAQMVKDGVL